MEVPTNDEIAALKAEIKSLNDVILIGWGANRGIAYAQAESTRLREELARAKADLEAKNHALVNPSNYWHEQWTIQSNIAHQGREARLKAESANALLRKECEGLREALRQEADRLDWLDWHCSFVANEHYNIGPFREGQLRTMADEGIRQQNNLAPFPVALQSPEQAPKPCDYASECYHKPHCASGSFDAPADPKEAK